MKEVRIGSATLYHGDCLEILPTIAQVDAIISDPPYGTKNNSSWSGLYKDCAIINDHDTSTRDRALERIGFRRALIFGSWKQPRPKTTRQILIWDKGGHCGMGDLSIPWKPNFEEIYVIGSGFEGSRDSCILHFISDRECNGVVRERFHPTEKPVPLMKALIKKTPGVILDPFMGSGTTGVACLEMGRSFIGIELDEKYFNTAVKRLEKALEQPDFFIEQRSPHRTTSPVVPT